MAKLYDEAKSYIERKQYREALEILNAISRVDPNYRDVGVLIIGIMELPPVTKIGAEEFLLQIQETKAKQKRRKVMLGILAMMMFMLFAGVYRFLQAGRGTPPASVKESALQVPSSSPSIIIPATEVRTLIPTYTHTPAGLPLAQEVASRMLERMKEVGSFHFSLNIAQGTVYLDEAKDIALLGAEGYAARPDKNRNGGRGGILRSNCQGESS